jgi:hypothetical protein
MARRLHALDLWRVVRVVRVDGEREVESTTLVHACISISLGGVELHLRVDAPSSGVIVSVKLRRSAGSGKLVFIVDGKSSSVKSMLPFYLSMNTLQHHAKGSAPFWTRI